MDAMDEIMAFVAGTLLGGAQEVQADSPLFSSGLLDSFHLLELLVFVEGRFGVRITPGDIRPELVDTPRLLAGLIWDKAAAASGGRG